VKLSIYFDIQNIRKQTHMNVGRHVLWPLRWMTLHIST